MTTEAKLREELAILNKNKDSTETELLDKLAAAEMEKSSLQTRISSFDNVRSGSDAKIAALNKELSVLEETKKAVEAQLNNEMASTKERESRQKAAEARISALDKENLSLKEQLSAAEQAKQEVSSLVSKNKQDLDKKLSDELASLKQEKKDIEAKLGGELVNLKKERETAEKLLKNKIAALEKEVESRRAEAEDLKGLSSAIEEKLKLDNNGQPQSGEEGQTGVSAAELKEQKEEKAVSVIEEKTSGTIIGKDVENREIWIDFGINNGVKVGQAFDVYRENVKTAELKALKIFDTFTVAKPLADQDFDILKELDNVVKK